MLWEEEILAASLCRDHARFQRLHDEHIRSLRDLERLLEYAAKVFGMSRDEMEDAIEAFVKRKTQ